MIDENSLLQATATIIAGAFVLTGFFIKLKPEILFGDLYDHFNHRLQFIGSRLFRYGFYIGMTFSLLTLFALVASHSFIDLISVSWRPEFEISDMLLGSSLFVVSVFAFFIAVIGLTIYSMAKNG